METVSLLSFVLGYLEEQYVHSFFFLFFQAMRFLILRLGATIPLLACH